MKLDPKELYRMAFHDVLTGLPNRALFIDRLHHELARARRRGEQVAVAFIDLDGLKSVNDAMGHDAGDAVLIEAARRLSIELRDEDTLARYGGDEYTLVARVASADAATVLARRLLDRVRGAFDVDGDTVDLKASLGIAIYPRDALDERDLIQRADAAMYAAKSAGGSAYRTAAETPPTIVGEQTSAWAAAERALDRGGLEVLFRPVYDARARRFVGVDAIPHVIDPERGCVPLDHVLRGEECKVMPRNLAEWYLGTSCIAAAAWRDRGVSFGRVGVRLNARQFLDPETCDLVLGAASRSGLSPRQIEVAVAEPCAVGEEAAVRASLVRMFGAGVAVTVERFGEGLHRTGGLNGFSAPPMRLGPEVVRQLGDDDASAEAIRRFVALCRSSRLHLIAEAVDNGVTMRILRENGCHLLQGEVVGGTVCAHEIPLVLGTSDVFFRTRLWRTLAGA